MQGVGGPVAEQVFPCHLPPASWQVQCAQSLGHLWDKMPTPSASEPAGLSQGAPHPFLILHFLGEIN